MLRQLPTWQWILEKKKERIGVVLLYVTESWGSSPGRRGFMMAVGEDGVTHGSIGGGILEHKFVELAKKRLQHGDNGPTLFRQNHNKQAAENQSGMICSGGQTICLKIIQNEDLGAIEQLVTSITGRLSGTLTITPAGLSFSTETGVVEFQKVSDVDWHYTEQTSTPDKLYIVGAGHCSLALSEVMNRLNFEIHLFDDREALATFETNSFAKAKIVVDYSQVDGLIEQVESSYVVVMTQGYRTDLVALKCLVALDTKFIGVLGSKSKVSKILDDLKKDGISEQYISKIHAPVGVAIKSETPEEIAISIAAQIIMIRNQVTN